MNMAGQADAHQAAGAWLIENLSSLARAITDRHFAAHPELQQRYGSRGRQRCEEDAAYHLHFLAEAVAMHSPASFLSYVEWAKAMLAARSIDASDLANHLAGIRDALGESGGPHRPIYTEFLDSALAALPNMAASPPPSFADDAPFAGIANEYLRLLLLLDASGAAKLILNEVEKGLRVKDLFEHVLVPAQHEIGRLWQLNRINVVQEHYCTAATDAVITQLRRKFLGVGRNATAVLLCPPGEDHCVALKLLAGLLESDGWTVLYIGARTPLSDAAKFVAGQSVDAIAISVTAATHLSSAANLVRALKAAPGKTQRAPKIVVGGAAFAPDDSIWKTVGADAYAPTLLEGVEKMNSLLSGSPA